MPQDNKLKARLKLIGTVVTVASLLFSIAQFTWNQSVQAAQPYLQKKLAWREEAVETTSFIATTESVTTTLTDKTQRFKQLYWGVMGMVENANVCKAMSEFNTALNNKDSSIMKSASLNLAHACRQEMAARGRLYGNHTGGEIIPELAPSILSADFARLGELCNSLNTFLQFESDEAA